MRRRSSWLVGIGATGIFAGALGFGALGVASASTSTPPPITANQGAAGKSPRPVSGTVGISSLPSLPAGTNNIGSVGVSSLPSLPAGTNDIGTVHVASPGGLASSFGCQVPDGSTITAQNVDVYEGALTNLGIPVAAGGIVNMGVSANYTSGGGTPAGTGADCEGAWTGTKPS